MQSHALKLSLSSLWGTNNPARSHMEVLAQVLKIKCCVAQKMGLVMGSEGAPAFLLSADLPNCSEHHQEIKCQSHISHVGPSKTFFCERDSR